MLHVSRVAVSYFANVNHKLLFRMQWSCRSGEGVRRVRKGRLDQPASAQASTLLTGQHH